MDDIPYRMLRASVFASALIGATLSLPIKETLAQSGTGMSDMKKLPPMSGSKMGETTKAATARLGRSLL